MNEIVEYREQSPLAVQIEYASRVAAASMLPDNYRNKPADIMLAIGLGQSMGLSPAESLYRISVIKGKPTASAELIAANVRKAGHRLRVTGDETSATCTIIRADDPDFDFTVTRDLEWAKRMGLATNDNYRKQAGTMLQWRAISACARLACPEALYGVSYIPDEMGDMPEAPRTGGGLGAAIRGESITVTQETPAVGGAEDPQGLGDVDAQATGQPQAMRADAPAAESLITKRTRGQLFALFAQKGIDEADQLSGTNHLCGTDYTSRSQISEESALRVIEFLKTKPDAQPDADSTAADALPEGGVE